MAEPLTTDDIFDPKNLPQEVPESNDLLMFRDISESAPNTIMKVCTPAQALIDDTSESNFKTFSSTAINKKIDAFGRKIATDCNTPDTVYMVYDSNTLNSPYKEGLTGGAEAGCIITCSVAETYTRNVQLALARTSGSENIIFIRHMNANGIWNKWQRIIKESDLNPIPNLITFASGTTTEAGNCTYTTIGKLCIVNIAGFTDTNSSRHVIISNLPKAAKRANIKYIGQQTLLIDQASTNLEIIGSISNAYLQFIYPTL